MDFFDKLGQKASETYKFTTSKTSKIAKEAKTKMAMNENKAKIKDLYLNIGEEVYQNYIREEKINLEEFLTHKCEEIDVISNEIERQREEILALNHKKQCENCYTQIDIDANFCPNCGSSQDVAKSQNADVQIIQDMSKEDNNNDDNNENNDDVIKL